jgi:secreted trypsin-like serine protease
MLVANLSWSFKLHLTPTSLASIDDFSIQRIYGGQQAKLGQFPYMASLREPKGNHFCGGFILTEKWIGTSGNCAYRRYAPNVLVAVGAIDRFDGGVFYEIEKIFAHPKFDNPMKMNDIGLAQTKSSIKMNKNIQSVPIALGFGFEGLAIVTGWGKTVGNSAVNSKTLKFVEVEVIDNESCKMQLYEEHSRKVYNETLCTISVHGIGACHGENVGIQEGRKRLD